MTLNPYHAVVGHCPVFFYIRYKKNLAPSYDFSMVSNLTNHQFTTKAATRSHSEEIYEEVKARTRNEKPKRLSTEDYIKKYSSGLKTAPNKSQSQHFFSDL